MIKRFLFLLIFSLPLIYAQAQWVSQWAGYTTVRQVSTISTAAGGNAWLTFAGTGIPGALTPEYAKTSNGGMVWQPGSVPAAAHYGLGNIFVYDTQHVWACLQSEADTGGMIFFSQDGGSNWAEQPTAGFQVNPVFVFFWDADSGVSVGNPVAGHFEIYTTINGGSQWDTVPADDMPFAYDFHSTYKDSWWAKGDTLWFGGNTEGRIFVSYDRGYHWSFIPFPETSVSHVFFRDSAGFAGNPDPLNNHHAFYFTQDYGAHWEKISADGLMNTHSITYVPGTQSTLIAVGEYLQISNNWGETWSLMQNPLQPSPWYTSVAFSGISEGWLGGINFADPGQGGIYKYNGPALLTEDQAYQPISLSMYPNPVSDICSLSWHQEDNGKASICILDMSGRMVLNQQAASAGRGAHNIGIDVSGITPGLYMLGVQNAGGSSFKKLIIR